MRIQTHLILALLAILVLIASSCLPSVMAAPVVDRGWLPQPNSGITVPYESMAQPSASGEYTLPGFQMRKYVPIAAGDTAVGVTYANNTVTSKDTRISKQNPTFNYGANVILVVQSDNAGVNRGRTLLEFDLDPLNIPTNAVITAATFSMYYYDDLGPDPAGQIIDVYKLDRTDWVEGTGNGAAVAGATWNDYNGSTWDTAGGDYSATNPSKAAATIPAIGTRPCWMDWDVAGMVQEAHDNSNDLELLVRNRQETTSDYMPFWEASEAAGSNEPLLDITYQVYSPSTDYQVELTVYAGAGNDSPGVVYLNNECDAFPIDIDFTAVDGNTTIDAHPRSYDGNSTYQVYDIEIPTDLASNGGFYIYFKYPWYMNTARYVEIMNEQGYWNDLYTNVVPYDSGGNISGHDVYSIEQAWHLKWEGTHYFSFEFLDTNDLETATMRLGYFHTTDLDADTYTRSTNLLLDLGAGGKFDDGGVGAGAFFYPGSGDYIYMLYHGHDGTSWNSTGIARCHVDDFDTDMDENDWTRLNSGDPVIAPSGTPADWNEDRAVNPSAWWSTDDSVAYAIVTGRDISESAISFGIYSSVSPFTTWTEGGDNPIIEKGAGGTWNDEGVAINSVWDFGNATVGISFGGYGDAIDWDNFMAGFATNSGNMSDSSDWVEGDDNPLWQPWRPNRARACSPKAMIRENSVLYLIHMNGLNEDNAIDLFTSAHRVIAKYVPAIGEDTFLAFSQFSTGAADGTIGGLDTWTTSEDFHTGGGLMYPTDVSLTYAGWDDATFGNCVVKTRIDYDTDEANDWAGIGIRKANPTDTSAASGITVFVRDNGEMVIASSGVGHIVSGSMTTSDTWHTLEVESTGSRHKVSWDGVLKETYYNSDFLSDGYVQIADGTNNGDIYDIAMYDYFTVAKYVGGGPTVGTAEDAETVVYFRNFIFIGTF